MAERKKRVLIVDDDATLVKMMQIYFKNSGMETHIETRGLKAIEAIGSFNPDVMILDIMMPEMDGIKVCRKIRTELGNHTLPIIALTGFHKEEREKQIMAAGANLYLTKPIEMSKLLSHVKTLAAGQGGSQAQT